MKFSAQEVLKLEAFGIQIEEYCEGKENPFPIDCAVVHFRNNEYPCKINHGFFEAFLCSKASVKFFSRTERLCDCVNTISTLSSRRKST